MPQLAPLFVKCLCQFMFLPHVEERWRELPHWKLLEEVVTIEGLPF